MYLASGDRAKSLVPSFMKEWAVIETQLSCKLKCIAAFKCFTKSINFKHLQIVRSSMDFYLGLRKPAAKFRMSFEANMPCFRV